MIMLIYVDYVHWAGVLLLPVFLLPIERDNVLFDVQDQHVSSQNKGVRS